MVAPEVKGQVGSAEVYFAKRLANTDKKVRDKSIKRLRLWISCKVTSGKGFEESDMLKLWKGLFYCMWFTDKLLVQEEMADTLSEILELFKPCSSQGILFAKVFFTTMGREWHGIDRLRMDKFYMLVKKYIGAVYRYLCNSDWSELLVKETSAFLTDLLLSENYPDGLKMFWAEYAVKEISSASSNTSKFPDKLTMLALLDPFCMCIALCKSKTVQTVVCNEVLNKLLKEVGTDDDVNFEVPTELFANRLFELVSNKAVQTRSRKKLLSYTKRFRVCHSDVPVECPQVKKAKKRKSSESTSLDESTLVPSTDEIVNERRDQPEERKKKRKKKEAKTGEVISTESETIASEVVTSTSLEDIVGGVSNLKQKKKNNNKKKKVGKGIDKDSDLNEVAEHLKSSCEVDNNKGCVKEKKKQKSKNVTAVETSQDSEISHSLAVEETCVAITGVNEPNITVPGIIPTVDADSHEIVDLVVHEGCAAVSTNSEASISPDMEENVETKIAENTLDTANDMSTTDVKSGTDTKVEHEIDDHKTHEAVVISSSEDESQLSKRAVQNLILVDTSNERKASPTSDVEDTNVNKLHKSSAIEVDKELIIIDLNDDAETAIQQSDVTNLTETKIPQGILSCKEPVEEVGEGNIAMQKCVEEDTKSNKTVNINVAPLSKENACDNDSNDIMFEISACSHTPAVIDLTLEESECVKSPDMVYNNVKDAIVIDVCGKKDEVDHNANFSEKDEVPSVLDTTENIDEHKKQDISMDIPNDEAGKEDDQEEIFNKCSAEVDIPPIQKDSQCEVKIRTDETSDVKGIVNTKHTPSSKGERDGVGDGILNKEFIGVPIENENTEAVQTEVTDVKEKKKRRKSSRTKQIVEESLGVHQNDTESPIDVNTLNVLNTEAVKSSKGEKDVDEKITENITTDGVGVDLLKKEFMEAPVENRKNEAAKTEVTDVVKEKKKRCKSSRTKQIVEESLGVHQTDTESPIDVNTLNVLNMEAEKSFKGEKDVDEKFTENITTDGVGVDLLKKEFMEAPVENRKNEVAKTEVTDVVKEKKKRRKSSRTKQIVEESLGVHKTDTESPIDVNTLNLLNTEAEKSSKGEKGVGEKFTENITRDGIAVDLLKKEFMEAPVENENTEAVQTRVTDVLKEKKKRRKSSKTKQIVEVVHQTDTENPIDVNILNVQNMEANKTMPHVITDMTEKKKKRKKRKTELNESEGGGTSEVDIDIAKNDQDMKVIDAVHTIDEHTEEEIPKTCLDSNQTIECEAEESIDIQQCDIGGVEPVVKVKNKKRKSSKGTKDNDKGSHDAVITRHEDITDQGLIKGEGDMFESSMNEANQQCENVVVEKKRKRKKSLNRKSLDKTIISKEAENMLQSYGLINSDDVDDWGVQDDWLKPEETHCCAKDIENSASHTSEEHSIPHKKKRKSIRKSKNGTENETVKNCTQGNNILLHAEHSADESSVSKIINEPKQQVESTSDEQSEIGAENSVDKFDKQLNSRCTSSKQKKNKKTLCDSDVPQPIASFLKTPPPSSETSTFFRKAVTQTEVKTKKQKVKRGTVTPKSEPGKKRVHIELSNNKSVAARDLHISPHPAFSPTRRPNRSSIKRDLTKKRSKAADFF